MSIAPVIPIRARIPQWSFPERLRKVRRDEMRLTQEKFSELLEVNLSTYGAWESGRNTPDILKLSEKLEDITGVSKHWFRGDLDGYSATPPDGDTPSRISERSRLGYLHEVDFAARRPVIGRIAA